MVTIQNAVEQPQQWRIVETALEQFQDNRVVDRVEEAADIQLQVAATAAAVLLRWGRLGTDLLSTNGLDLATNPEIVRNEQGR